MQIAFEEHIMISQASRTTPPAPTNRLLNIDEAAAYLNVPRRWVEAAVRQRRIRCSRIGKHVRFRLEHLDEFVAASEQPVTALPDATIVALSTRGSGRSRL